LNLLQNLFVPESVTDIFILKFGLFFSLLLVLPYLSMLVGSLLFSLLHITKSRDYNNTEYKDFAKYSIELVTNKMWMRIIFGILPFFGVAYFYSQLYASNLSAAENLFFGFLLFVAGLCISVIYKGSFKFQDNSADISKVKTFVKSGWFGFFILLIAVYIVVGYLQTAVTPLANSNTSLMAVLFSTVSGIYFLLFLAISFSITSAVIVARLNRASTDYSFIIYAKEFSTKTGILFAFLQPLLFVLAILSVSNYSLSFSFFFASLLALLIMMIISIQFYTNYRKQNLKNTSIVFLFLLLFSILIYSSQLASEKVGNREAVKQGKVFNIFS